MKTQNSGFTLIEMLMVVAVLAILALLALPSYQGKIVRDQIVEGSALAALAKGPIATQWTATKTLAADNSSLALPAPDKIVNNLVRAVTVQDGAIHITYGNRANGHLKDKTLTLRPAVVEDAPVVPVTWVCGFASGPGKTTTMGENKTNISKEYLPTNCR